MPTIFDEIMKALGIESGEDSSTPVTEQQIQNEMMTHSDSPRAQNFGQALDTGVPYSQYYNRIDSGWQPEDARTVPPTPLDQRIGSAIGGVMEQMTPVEVASVIPTGFGDLSGLAADVNYMSQDEKNRTVPNALLTLAGIAPLIPPMLTTKKVVGTETTPRILQDTQVPSNDVVAPEIPTGMSLLDFMSLEASKPKLKPKPYEVVDVTSPEYQAQRAAMPEAKPQAEEPSGYKDFEYVALPERGYYSKLQEAIEGLPDNAITPEAAIKFMRGRGVTDEELADTGMGKLIMDQERVTKEFLRDSYELFTTRPEFTEFGNKLKYPKILNADPNELPIADAENMVPFTDIERARNQEALSQMYGFSMIDDYLDPIGVKRVGEELGEQKRNVLTAQTSAIKENNPHLTEQDFTDLQDSFDRNFGGISDEEFGNAVEEYNKRLADAKEKAKAEGASDADLLFMADENPNLLPDAIKNYPQFITERDRIFQRNAPLTRQAGVKVQPAIGELSYGMRMEIEPVGVEGEKKAILRDVDDGTVFEIPIDADTPADEIANIQRDMWQEARLLSENTAKSHRNYTQNGLDKDTYESVIISGRADGTSTPYKMTGSHIPEKGDLENAFVHIRGSHRQTIDGDSTYFVEELQGDWHQQGRKFGFQGENHAQDLDRVLEAQRVGEQANKEAGQTLAKSWFGDDINNYVGSEPTLDWGLLDKLTPEGKDQVNKIGQVFGFPPNQLTDQRYAQIVEKVEKAVIDVGEKKIEGAELQSRIRQIAKLKETDPKVKSWIESMEEQVKLDNTASKMQGKVPNAPFKNKAYIELAMKEAIQRAIKQGQQGIAIATPDQIAHLYYADFRIKNDPSILKKYNQYKGEMPAFLEETAKKYGAKVMLKEVDFGGEWVKVPYLKFTPKMIERIEKRGMPLYGAAGATPAIFNQIDKERQKDEEKMPRIFRTA